MPATAYYAKIGCYENRIIKMFEIEKQYDDLSVIRPHEIPQLIVINFFRKLINYSALNQHFYLFQE